MQDEDRQLGGCPQIGTDLLALALREGRGDLVHQGADLRPLLGGHQGVPPDRRVVGRDDLSGA